MSKNAPKISYLQKLQIDHFDHSGSVERANNNSKRAFGNKIHLALGTIVHSWVGRQWPMGSRNVAKHVLAQGQSGPIPRSCRCHLSFLSFTPGRKSPPPPPPTGDNGISAVETRFHTRGLRMIYANVQKVARYSRLGALAGTHHRYDLNITRYSSMVICSVFFV